MSQRRNNRWTAEKLESMRKLYEGGKSVIDIGRIFGVASGTVSVMAWQRKWQRRQPTQLPAPPKAAPQLAALPAPAGEQGVVVARAEQEFNEQLMRTIKRYWRQRGVAIELRLEPEGGGATGIRSKSRNGEPSRR